jgi:hypothetical protein
MKARRGYKRIYPGKKKNKRRKKKSAAMSSGL